MKQDKAFFAGKRILFTKSVYLDNYWLHPASQAPNP